ncbi:MAG: acyl carrier protein [Bacteroidota bacterium]
MNTIQRVINLVSWQVKVPTSHLCPTTNLKEDLNLDAIDMLALILYLERWFGIALTAEEVDRIETVKDASDCFNRYIAA